MSHWIDEIAAKPGAITVLTAIGAGRYQLRLDSLSSHLTPAQHDGSMKAAGADGTRWWIGAPFVDVVMAVLLARLTAPAETAEAFSLAYGTQPIAWGDFFFNGDEHKAAYTRMAAVREAIPVAVHGRIDWLGTMNFQAARVAVLAFPTIDGTRLSVFSRSLEQFDECKRGDEVIALGLWGTRVANVPISLSNPSQTATLALARMEPLCPKQVEVVTSTVPANSI